MGFPKEVAFKNIDSINDQIWSYQHEGNLNTFHMLDREKFGFQFIEREIRKGMSPCPDIVTKDFGKKFSVLFVSSVYGHLYKYINKTINRDKENWSRLIPIVYEKLIRDRVGIYDDLNVIYQLITDQMGFHPEFCITDLVKTALFSSEDKVSGLDDHYTFRKYFSLNEYSFLVDRIAQVQDRCIIFAMKDISFLSTIAALEKEKVLYSYESLPSNIECFYPLNLDLNELTFRSFINKNKNPSLEIGYKRSTYTKSIAFQTIFKFKNREIYIVPLSHPASKAYGHWPRTSLELQKIMKPILKKIPF